MRRNYFYLISPLPAKRSIGCLVIFFFLAVTVRAQLFQPHVDNVFVEPAGSARWNVLSNDELGTCHWSEVTVAITVNPQHAKPGTVSVEGMMNLVHYTPQDGFWGRDSLQYSVYAPKLGETKTAWVYINVSSQPDNLYTDVCTATPPTQVWGIKDTRTNEINLSPYQNAICGDIDGDSIPEILVCMNPVDGTMDGVYRHSPQIAIYKGDDLSAPPRIINTVKRYSWNFYTKYGIVKTRINEKDSTLIVVAEGDLYLRAYNYNGDLIWTSSDTYHSVSNSQEYGSPVFSDLNHDGIPEVLCCGKVFDSVTGQLLCAAPVELATGYNLSIPVVADLYGTGNMNIINGNYIYSISSDLSTMTLVRKIIPAVEPTDPDAPATLPTLVDGGSMSAVDMDNDGKPDLIGKLNFASAEYTFLYIADPETGVIKASKYIPDAGESSYPFVGDIDGDGFPEIVIIKNKDTSTTPAGIRLILAYKYVPGNPVLQEFWRLDHTDNSGNTGITLFDFNQDGISELVYRDERHLRIINGSLKSHITGQDTIVYNLAQFNCISGTRTEYPVIADVDGDGQAEIMIVGAHGDIAGTNGHRGCLWVFKSEFPDESPWAPARKVWNQYAFNPVHINEDLTVPRYPLSPVTEFVTKTGKRHRPYNNFLQQATELNNEGEPLHLAPDISFVFGYPASTIYKPAEGKVEVTVFTVNEGNAPTTSPLYISVYAVKDDDSYVYLYTQETDTVIAPNRQLEITFSFPYTPQNDYKGFEIRLNEKEGVFFFDECLTANNYTRGKMFSPDERIMCKGSTELIQLYPQGIYTYLWFTYDEGTGSYDGPLNENSWISSADGGEYRIGTGGETLEITKNGEVVEKFYLLLLDQNGDPLSSDLDSVCVYLTPDTLIWTGAQSADWHNHGNWLDPTETDPYDPVYPSSKIPRKCTNVLIPDGLMVYPDLSPSSTTYYEYVKSQCANITFEHGGEVIRTDSLDYDRAYVSQELMSNRWYMLAAPLGDFYPGDYYVHNPNPHLDDVYIYTAFFGRSNPQSNNYVEGQWTGTFNTPGIKFNAGMGFAVWVDDKQPDLSIHTPTLFSFPKYDTGYLIYSWEGNVLHTHPSTRDIHHRFIYEEEGVWNKATGEITLPVAVSAANTKVIVGNPFMAHWDFASFQAANPIKNYYQVLDGTGQNFSTYFQYGTGATNDPSITITTANPPLDEYIAPMQSVLIESTAAFNSLSTHVSHVASGAGVKLRAAAGPGIQPLYIDVAINGHTNRTVLLLDPGNTLNGEGNVLKVLLKENLSFQVDKQGNIITDYPYPVSIYTLSGDGSLLDVQSIPQEGISIPIGISTLQKGTVRLSFEGMEDISARYDLYLVDKEGGFFTENIKLSEQPWYEFEKQHQEAFLNDRFYLTILRKGTSMDPVINNESNICLHRQGNTLYLKSMAGENIEEIVVTDLHGRILFKSTTSGNSEVSIQPSATAEGFYLVRANTRSCSRVFKVYY
ncbi:MAG: hypothetical protein LUG18_15870 [Candidatus Azobacteroides sp.]|nr:hypothetical protein [Candidatus Azobacteroides sp.]